MKRKKWTALMIAACMTALSITGCGAKQTDQTGGEVSTGQETAEAVSTEDSKDMFNESGQLPILKEKEKITIGIAQLSQVIDYDTNALTKKIEEDVNVDIEFVFFLKQMHRGSSPLWRIQEQRCRTLLWDMI